MIYGPRARRDHRGRRKGGAHPCRATIPPRPCSRSGSVFVVSGLAFKRGRGALPHVDPRRVPRRALGRDALHQHRTKLAAFAMAIRLLVNALQPLRGHAQFRAAGRTCSSSFRCCPWRSGTSPRSRRATSSACSPIRHLAHGLYAARPAIGIVGGNALSAPEAWSSAMFYAWCTC